MVRWIYVQYCLLAIYSFEFGLRLRPLFVVFLMIAKRASIQRATMISRP